jgi:hypothetical protein
MHVTAKLVLKLEDFKVERTVGVAKDAPQDLRGQLETEAREAPASAALCYRMIAITWRPAAMMIRVQPTPMTSPRMGSSSYVVDNPRPYNRPGPKYSNIHPARPRTTLATRNHMAPSLEAS